MRIGIDLGGTKIAGLALADDGRVLAYQRVPAAPADYDLTLTVVRELVERLERETGERGSVGIGTPGAISPASGLLRNSNSPCLNGKPLDRDLRDVLGRDIRMANDADCFTLSEATDGAGEGAPSVFGVILGTGVGGGLVIHGKLVEGPNAITGEWGHNVLPNRRDNERPGPECYCGRRGCIETFLSGPGLAGQYRVETGVQLRVEEIIDRVGRDPAASRCLDDYIDRLGRALSVVVNIVDPHVIVLGGGLSNIQALYEQTGARWHQWIFSDHVDTQLVKNRHGDDSGVRGAAWLWDTP